MHKIKVAGYTVKNININIPSECVDSTINKLNTCYYQLYTFLYISSSSNTTLDNTRPVAELSNIIKSPDAHDKLLCDITFIGPGRDMVLTAFLAGTLDISYMSMVDTVNNTVELLGWQLSDTTCLEHPPNKEIISKYNSK